MSLRPSTKLVVRCLLPPLLGLGGCGALPDELNLSPLYRHRVDPAGNVVELDLLWPLFSWQKDMEGGTDVRLRPLWRRVANADATKTRHEFLVPFGEARFDSREDVARLFPLFYYREHLHEGEPGSWDRDWWFTPLIWGGSSAGGENYLAVFPIYGSIPQFLSYDRFSFLLFPLSMWTTKGDTTGMHLLWPLIGWGGADDPKRPYWWRVLPFFGKSIRPGRSESYTALWPFIHWGSERLDKPRPYDSFFLFPLFGWKSGGEFLSWTVLWPFFRHAHRVATGRSDEPGDYSYWDFPWPLFRILDDTWSPDELHQWWLTPLVASTKTKKQDSLVLLYPLLWFRHFWNERSDRSDTYILPFFWKNRIRYRKKDEADTFEVGEDFHWKLWPLADWRETRNSSTRFRTLDLFPFDGNSARGIREAWDWAWTLAETEADGRGNRRTRTFANLWSSRNFAGRRYQCSVPFLFNYESRAGGERTLRLLQLIPITWRAGENDR